MCGQSKYDLYFYIMYQHIFPWAYLIPFIANKGQQSIVFNVKLWSQYNNFDMNAYVKQTQDVTDQAYSPIMVIGKGEGESL